MSCDNIIFVSLLQSNIIGLIEDLINRVHEIRVKQDEIIDFQIDLKADMLHTQRYNNTTFDKFSNDIKKFLIEISSHDKASSYENNKMADQHTHGKVIYIYLLITIY